MSPISVISAITDGWNAEGGWLKVSVADSEELDKDAMRLLVFRVYMICAGQLSLVVGLAALCCHKDALTRFCLSIMSEHFTALLATSCAMILASLAGLAYFRKSR